MSRYTIAFQIPGLPKTINSMGRSHWTVKANEAKLWRNAVVYAVGRNRPAKPLKYARVTYTRVSASPIDADNLAMSFKHIQDGLIDAGVIENDRLENIGFPTYRWEKGQRNQGRVKVTVTEADHPLIDGSDAAELVIERVDGAGAHGSDTDGITEEALHPQRSGNGAVLAQGRARRTREKPKASKVRSSRSEGKPHRGQLHARVLHR